MLQDFVGGGHCWEGVGWYVLLPGVGGEGIFEQERQLRFCLGSLEVREACSVWGWFNQLRQLTLVEFEGKAVVFLLDKLFRFQDKWLAESRLMQG